MHSTSAPARRLSVAVAMVILAPIMPATPLLSALSMSDTAFAGAATDASATAEKQAFESAKELGTVDAWQAFLKTYATGFHADLARAYLQKLGASNATSPPAPSTAASSPAPAEELPCKLASTLKSQTSKTPAKVTFVNASGARRVIIWIDFNGKLKEYAELDDGKEYSQDTFLTHPWMVTNGPGDCVQIFMPVDGESVARLDVTNDQQYQRQSAPDSAIAPPKKIKKAKKSNDDEQDHGPTPEQLCRDIGEVYVDGVCMSKKKRKKAAKAAASSCIELGMAYRNGQCVAKTKKDIQQLKKQKKIGCPAGTYLNPLGKCQPNETGG